MWELERRTNLFKSHWKAPYWPTDGAAKMKWVALEGNAYTRHPFIPMSVEENKIAVPCLFKEIKEKKSLNKNTMNIVRASSHFWLK